MRFFIASGCAVATTMQYRCVHLQEQLQHLGHEAEIGYWPEPNDVNPARVENCDAIFIYRVAMSPPLRAFIDEARQAGRKVIFDIDDLVFEPELIQHHRAGESMSGETAEMHAGFVRRYLDTLLASDAVTVATPVLAEYVAKRGLPAFVHRNALGHEMQTLAQHLYERRLRVARERVNIVYGSGTPTHKHDFRQLESLLLQILKNFPNAELWIVGPLELSATLANDKQVRRFPPGDWREWFELCSLADVALAPLERDNIFCRAKSEIKFMEAAALVIPLIGSKTAAFVDCLAHGQNGFLATDESEWFEALTLLLGDGKRRVQVGLAARDTALKNYGGEKRANDLATLLPRLLDE